MSRFTPSPAEVALVNQIFTQVDTQKLGIITGDAAVKIFSGSKLSPTVLAEIWNLADEDNNGVLTRKGVAIAVRLLGHAQRGENITEALVNKPGPIPAIEAFTPQLVPQSTGVPTARSPPPGLPPLTAQDRAKFMKLFLGCGPISGILSGEKARDVFVKSKLPVDKLSQIWNLADTKNRGVLDAADFTIAMYLIQACMSGQLQTLPLTLPPGLYEQAGGMPAFEGVSVHATGGSVFSGRPMSIIEPHFTGQGSQRSAFPFIQPHATGSTPQWDVTATEKASADRLFETLDTQKKGYIEGEVAVPFMLRSNLSEDILAQVWDLADLNNDGHLTRDGFAVAMHLIQGKLNGKEIPASIPQTLIPPSMRTPTASPAVPSQPSVPEAIRDLIWDESPPTSATFPQQQQSVLQPQSTGTLQFRPAQATSPPLRSQAIPDPFATSSPFSVPTPHRDLLGDDDGAATTSSPPLQDRSAEIGNVKNQLSSTNKSLETVRAERESMERTLSEQAAQLSALQTQLSSAKAAYETETRLLNALRERFAAQTAEIHKAREELIHGESNLSAIRVEKAEVEGSFLRDKEEVRGLQRGMTEVGMQVETLKVEVEKAKKEAKQQKGLLAIAKKQLANREAEKAKVQKEQEEAQQELTNITKERESAEAELSKDAATAVANGHSPIASPDILAIAMAQPLPATPDIPTSPTSSIMSLGKSNNPFGRVAVASGTGSRSQSPFLPFTNSAAILTPPSAPIEAPADAPSPSPAPANPLGFSQPFSTDEAPATAEAPAESAAQPAITSPVDIMSPTDTEVFSTPPTTATPPVQSPAPQEPAQPVPAPTGTIATISNVESQESAKGKSTPAARADGQASESTDLEHQLKELDVDESDSDSGPDDNVPLAAVKARLSREFAEADTNGDAGTSAAPAISAFDDSFGISTSSEEHRHTSPPRSVPLTPTASSQPVVQDAFRVPSAPPFAQQDVFAAPVASTAETSAELNGGADETSGVHDFDEAMGKISASPSSNGGPSHVSQFTFDSAFDDNFDFAAATAATNPPPAVNGNRHPAAGSSSFSTPSNTFDSVFLSQPSSSVSQPPAPTPVQHPSYTGPGPFSQPAVQQETRPFSFDDAFGSGSGGNQFISSQSGASNPAHTISFDDAFGGRNSALALDTSFGSPQQQSRIGTAQSKHATAFPSNSPPLSPTGSASPQQTVRRSTSPPRHASPPLRYPSPRPRPSTASSDKEKAPSTRHSKLSIRLPFGRKKKAHDAPPMPPPLAAQQLVEEPTPAVDDDIEAVKQLCGMGFSRTQAVTALEMHGYDMQRALNSLLGTA